MDKTYSDYAASKTVELLGIDSPTGFTEKAAEWVKAQFEALGYTASITEKGGVLIELDGENAADALLLEAHTDTLGGMVAEIKSNGRLRLTNLGGTPAAARSSRVRSSSAMPPSMSTATSPTPSAASTRPSLCWMRTSSPPKTPARSASRSATSCALTRARG